MSLYGAGRLTFLGTGASLGVPVVGCRCAVCLSSDTRNKRLRSSVLVTWAKKQILIDAGPDLRLQALLAKVSHLDGVIITHAHHDHTASFDELRVFGHLNGRPLPLLLSQATFNDLKMRFYYILKSEDHNGPNRSLFDVHLLPSHRGKATFSGFDVSYISYLQGGMTVNGFRFGDLAYITDIKTYDEDIFDFLKGVKTLVLGALRSAPSWLHFSIDEAIAFAALVGAERTWLTHISHEIDHAETTLQLPPQVSLSYDGLEIDFQAIEE
jgi:phosphoribosyl 1,2-cyclic phosphate phosphodiesterase